MHKISYTLILIFCFLIAPQYLRSQDTIYTKSGEILLVEIIDQDSVQVNFEMERNGNPVTTFIRKTDLQRIGYKKKNTRTLPLDVASVGFGLGLDYGGGLGFNLQVYFNHNLGLTAGFGNTSAGLGYQVGLKLRKDPTKSEQPILPFIQTIYGTNYMVKISGGSRYDKLFSGLSLGAGLDIRFSRRSVSGITIGLLYPIQSPQVDDYVDQLSSQGVSFSKNQGTPLKISIGFRFGVRRLY